MTAPRAVRSARHRLVAEIGEAGVERLASAHVHLREAGLAGEIARRFLERAEVSVDAHDAPGPEEPAALAYLRGSLLALDHVARITGVRSAPLAAEALADLVRG